MAKTVEISHSNAAAIDPKKLSPSLRQWMGAADSAPPPDADINALRDVLAKGFSTYWATLKAEQRHSVADYLGIPNFKPEDLSPKSSFHWQALPWSQLRVLSKDLNGSYHTEALRFRDLFKWLCHYGVNN